MGVFVGLVPPLHRIFFNDQEEGGVLNARLTTSISNIGELFPSLQVVVVGVTLSSSLRKLKR
jgi:auxin efflux carrier family protein